MSVDLYLRAANAGALASACPFLRYEDENGDKRWLTDTAQFSLSVIGKIPPTYAMNEDGSPGDMTDPGDERFHANLRVLDDAILDLVPPDILTYPDTPAREWA